MKNKVSVKHWTVGREIAVPVGTHQKDASPGQALADNVDLSRATTSPWDGEREEPLWRGWWRSLTWRDPHDSTNSHRSK